MTFKPYNFQLNSSAKLVDFSSHFIYGEENGSVLLEMPTASGKTTTCALALNELLGDDSDLVAVFVSNGDLPLQANRTFKRLLKKNFPICDLQDVVSMGNIPSNSVLTLGWEILNKSEKDAFGNIKLLSKYVNGWESFEGLISLFQNLIASGKKIILVVDEAHQFFLTEASQAIVKMFQPSVVIQVTATPKDVNRSLANFTVKVDYDEVKATGLIKQNVFINVNLDEYKHLDGEEAVLEASYARFLERAEAYRLAGEDINPLIIIQCPSDNQYTQDSDRSMISKVKSFFEKKGITEENGLLAVWLSDERSPSVDNGELQKNNGKPVVLIFKTAVATGVDIPRASILAIFRKTNSITLSTQVAGRILRQPTLRIMGDELLDSSDIITNLSTEMIKFEGEDAGKVFKTYTCFLKPEAEAYTFNFPNTKMFATTKPILNLKVESLIIDKAEPLIQQARKKFNYNVKASQNVLGESETSSNIEDMVDALNNSDETIILGMSEYEINKTFRNTIGSIFSQLSSDTAQKYKLVSRGISVVEDLLQTIGVKKVDVPRFIVGNPENANIISVIITNIINELINTGEITPTRTYENTTYEGFPTQQNYLTEGVFVRTPYKKYAYNDAPLIGDSEVEKKFDELVDGLKTVTAWVNNPPNKDSSLGIKYETTNPQTGVKTLNTMYPDRLIMLADGTMIIAEIKNGRTTLDAADKSNALQKWINTTNHQIKNKTIKTDVKQIIGGIVDVDNTNGHNSYRIFVGDSYTPNRNNNGWLELTSIIPETAKTKAKEQEIAELEQQLALLKS